MFARVEAIRTSWVGAVIGVGLMLVGCNSRPTAPPAPSPAVQQFSIPTAIPLATQVSLQITPQPQPTSQPEPVVEQPAIRPPTLLDLKPGDQLELVADLAIPRSDFGVRLAFSPDGHLLLHSGGGLAIQRFDLLSNRRIDDLIGFELMSPLTISVSSDGSAVAADDGSQVRVWNSQTGQLTSALPLPPISTLASAGFYRDQLFYAVDYHGNVLVWDPNNWDRVAQFRYPGLVDAAMLSPNGDAIALQDHADRTQIAVYDLDGTERQVIRVQAQYPELLSVSPEGDRLLLHVDYGLPSEGVLVVSASTGETLLELSLLNFRRFAVSSDWQLLAAIGVDNELRLYSLPEGELLLSQQLGVTRTMSLEMSPAAEYLGLFAIKEPGQGGAIQVWGPAFDG